MEAEKQMSESTAIDIFGQMMRDARPLTEALIDTVDRYRIKNGTNEAILVSAAALLLRFIVESSPAPREKVNKAINSLNAYMDYSEAKRALNAKTIK